MSVFAPPFPKHYVSAALGQARPTLQSSLMQRMSSVLTRMLEHNPPPSSQPAIRHPAPRPPLQVFRSAPPPRPSLPQISPESVLQVLPELSERVSVQPTEELAAQSGMQAGKILAPTSAVGYPQEAPVLPVHPEQSEYGSSHMQYDSEQRASGSSSDVIQQTSRAQSVVQEGTQLLCATSLHPLPGASRKNPERETGEASFFTEIKSSSMKVQPMDVEPSTSSMVMEMEVTSGSDKVREGNIVIGGNQRQSVQLQSECGEANVNREKVRSVEKQLGQSKSDNLCPMQAVSVITSTHGYCGAEQPPSQSTTTSISTCPGSEDSRTTPAAGPSYSTQSSPTLLRNSSSESMPRTAVPAPTQRAAPNVLTASIWPIQETFCNLRQHFMDRQVLGDGIRR